MRTTSAFSLRTAVSAASFAGSEGCRAEACEFAKNSRVFGPRKNRFFLPLPWLPLPIRRSGLTALAMMARMNHSPCPLCRAPAISLPPIQKRAFLHCRQCDLIFVPPAQHLTPAEEKLRYQQHQNTLENEGYVNMLGRCVDLLRRHASDVRHVLDYGCGPSPVLVELLHRAGYQASGYDPFFATDVDLSNTFDAVTCVETSEHFAQPRANLQRILRLIRPQGYLAIMTRFHQGPDCLGDWWYARDPTHVAFYSHKTLHWICGEFTLTPLYLDDRDLALLQRT